MNIYGMIILAALLLDFALELIADILNLRHLSGELPPEFKDVYDENAYKKSQEYTRINTRFGFVSSTIGLLITLTFWFTGGFNHLDRIVRSWDLGSIWTGLVYIGFLLLFRMIISLPFSIYATFVIEERFGFNKTTPKTFVLDIVKGLLLAIVLGGPFLAGILAFFQYAGNLAWLYCWIVATVFSLFLQFIAPMWIMPIFNKFKPLEEGELKDRIYNYVQKVKYSLAGIFVMDGSKRSAKSNAFFTGFGKTKRIALYDTLISKHTVPELVAIIAHEIGHNKKKHVIIGTILSIIHMGIMFYLLSIFISNDGLFAAFLMEQKSVYAGLIFFGLLYTPIEMILSVLLNILSRKNEFQADRYAAVTTNDPLSMINALKKLSVDNLSNLRPHPFYVFANYSHPPVMQRITELNRITDV